MGKTLSHAARRTKGHNYERACARMLNHIFPNARRKLEYNSIDAEDNIDLQDSGIFSVQCKDRKNYVSLNTYHKIKEKEGMIPVLISKASRKKALCVIELSHFIQMLEKLPEEYINPPQISS